MPAYRLTPVRLNAGLGQFLGGELGSEGGNRRKLQSTAVPGA